LLSSRRSRREEQQFAFEGPELLRAAVGAGWPVERVFLAPEAHELPEVLKAVDAAERQGAQIHELALGVLERVADAATPQPCVGVAHSREHSLADLRLPGVVLVLDEVRDPGNLGAVIRVAEASGCGGVLLLGESADAFGPKALRASTGSSFRLPVVVVRNRDEAFSWMRERSVVTFATSSHAGADFGTLDWPASSAIILGNEAAGLSEETIAVCDRSVMIPMAEPVESLNLAVAAGILAMGATRHLKASEGLPQGSTMHVVNRNDDR